MELILLTKSSAPIIGQIAVLLGWIMDLIFRFTNMFGITNIGLCIIIFTILINLLMWPLTVSQQKSSRLMSVMQPELQAVQKKYRGKTDQQSMQRMQLETKAVYEKYGTSMTGGCLNLLIQLPILFALYQVIYKIPAYVPSVYQVFNNIAAPLSQEADIVQKLTEINSTIRPALEQGAGIDSIIDFLYRFTPQNWTALEAAYPAFSSLIAENAQKITSMNSFLGLNLAAPPWQGIKPNLAWIIPILSALTQWYSVKLMSNNNPAQKGGSDKENAMAQQMQTMNTMMPLMSLFFCFTLASGIGLYWVASGICRMVQQIAVNKKLNKMDINELIRQNVEKAAKKAVRRGKNPNQAQNEVQRTLKTAQFNEKKQIETEREVEQRSQMRVKQLADSNAYYNKNAKPGSLAAKANMVAMYDQRQYELKRGKKAPSQEVKAEEKAPEAVKTEEKISEAVKSEEMVSEAVKSEEMVSEVVKSEETNE